MLETAVSIAKVKGMLAVSANLGNAIAVPPSCIKLRQAGVPPALLFGMILCLSLALIGQGGRQC